MAATTKPPEIRPRTEMASSGFPRAAPCMKPEMPKVSLLRERSVCAGRARPTPPRKDWRGVGPGTGIEGEEMSVRREKASETFFENVKERGKIYDKVTDHWQAPHTCQTLFGSVLGSPSDSGSFSWKTVTTFGRMSRLNQAKLSTFAVFRFAFGENPSCPRDVYFVLETEAGSGGVADLVRSRHRVLCHPISDTYTHKRVASD